MPRTKKTPQPADTPVLEVDTVSFVTDPEGKPVVTGDPVLEVDTASFTTDESVDLTAAAAAETVQPLDPAKFAYKQAGRVIVCPVCSQQARCDINQIPICPTSVPGCPRGATD